jgi:hypothetical protein
VTVGEREFQRMVVELARLCGWLVYHTYDSRRCVPGFPDLLLLRGAEQLVAELKVGRRQPTAEQLAWLAAFRAAGVPAYVWRETDWPEIQRVLAR